MLGDYIMVAADVKGRINEDGTRLNPEGTYEYGDLVETSLGTGIVVDHCGRSVNTRKDKGYDYVHYDIYTAWHDKGKYQHLAYCDNPNCTSHYHNS